MKGIAVRPGEPGSLHLAELPVPEPGAAGDGGGVLVRVLRVGICGTDREIVAGEYGKAPPGADFLVLGHENFGVVEEVADGVGDLAPGDHVVAMVRRPGTSIYDRLGAPDMTTDDVYYEHGISLLHGFMRPYYADTPEFLVKVPVGLREVGVLLEPANGVLVLYSVTGGGREFNVPADAINMSFVLGNKAMVGTVNAGRRHMEAAVRDLSFGEMQYPGWLSRLITNRIDGTARYEEAFDGSGAGDIKRVIEISRHDSGGAP